MNESAYFNEHLNEWMNDESIHFIAHLPNKFFIVHKKSILCFYFVFRNLLFNLYLKYQKYLYRGFPVATIFIFIIDTLCKFPWN